MIVALLTDFGTRDHYVASLLGTILSIARDVTIVDITHDIEPQNVDEAAYTLGCCYLDFPKGTIFLAVVDPGVGSERRPVALRTGGRYFVGPDNGLFGFLLGEPFEAFEIADPAYTSARRSATFHGRDVFAPAAAHLANGVEISSLGPQLTDLRILTDHNPRADRDRTFGTVVHVDRFGNLITDLTVSDLAGGFVIRINGREVSNLRRFYDEEAGGEPFAIIGSTGRVEISVNRGSAARVLDVRAGLRFELRKTTPPGPAAST